MKCSLILIPVPTGLFIHNKFCPLNKRENIDGRKSFDEPKTRHCIRNWARRCRQSRQIRADWFQDLVTDTSGEEGSPATGMADLIKRDADELASIEAIDASVRYTDSMEMDIPQAVSCLRYYARWANKIDGRSIEIDGGAAYMHREPLEVYGAIMPWNAPL